MSTGLALSNSSFRLLRLSVCRFPSVCFSEGTPVAAQVLLRVRSRPSVINGEDPVQEGGKGEVVISVR